MVVLGLMSGTSMDGIDAALIKTHGTVNHFSIIGYHSESYTAIFKIILKATEFAIRQADGNMLEAEQKFEDFVQQYLLSELGLSGDRLEEKIQEIQKFMAEKWGKDKISLQGVVDVSTNLHTQVAKALMKKYPDEQVQLVGYHGQTFFHQPKRKISIILGDGQKMADTLAVRVINDFRSTDVQSGGQGAPFAPIYHLALLRRDKMPFPCAVVNCGGISNITYMPSDNPTEMVAFDVGPGNGLLDRFVRQRTNGEKSMDENGNYASRGKVDEAILEILHQKAIVKNGVNQLDLYPPKSLDSADLVLPVEMDLLSIEDGCRTLSAFTAETIALSPKFICGNAPKRWLLAGGGCNNPVILLEIKTRLKSRWGEDVQVLRADDCGWNVQYLEAELMAFLAALSLNKYPISFPKTTGVKFPMTGGVLYEPKITKEL
jgi:anhydro-N-acetylmuramic acid kinase